METETERTEATEQEQDKDPRLSGALPWEQIKDEGPVPPEGDGDVEAELEQEREAGERAAATEPVVKGDPVEVEVPEPQGYECQLCGTLYTGLGLSAGHPPCGHGFGNFRLVPVVKA